ncbi:DUF2231 domain-containing protein [Candidatus Chloroploca sp. Khr17]|uniref:DUF2231 domain-containing protein n=1 Tax=Candidatus Chloroploca sp. Khr17 TaxID=2496869 RepID=UPI00101E223E|nr:DUF2231 domain-containing protein [Candidatus Chloroploca sp. Khr17]
MYVLHPITVHFPIALLLVSTLFTFFALRQVRGAWVTSAYHCLLVGWFAGVVAVLTGLFDAARHLTGPDALYTNELIGQVNAHAFTSIAALLVYGLALLRHRRQPDLLEDAEARRGYLRLHVLGAALLMVGGWLGGYLVYVAGLGVR